MLGAILLLLIIAPIFLWLASTYLTCSIGIFTAEQWALVLIGIFLLIVMILAAARRLA